MKKLVIMLMMITVLLFSKDVDLEKNPKFVKYKVAVLDYSHQVLLQYSQDLHSIYATKKQMISYMRVCILVKYSYIIVKGFKDGNSEMDTMEKIFDTGLKKCTRSK